MEIYKDGVIPPFQTTGEKKNPEVEEWRGILGAYGINGSRQTMKMATMSDGLKTRTYCYVLSCLMLTLYLT